jgi:hypothetical protein
MSVYSRIWQQELELENLTIFLLEEIYLKYNPIEIEFLEPLHFLQMFYKQHLLVLVLGHQMVVLPIFFL